MIKILGHIHPLVVHLPIGILLMGLLLQWLSAKEKYASLKPAASITLLCGCITAATACITGYLLSARGDYNTRLVSAHMWTGIGVVLASAVLYTKEINQKVEINKKLLGVALLLLIVITGHLGSSLTRGPGYLVKPFVRLGKSDSVVVRATNTP